MAFYEFNQNNSGGYFVEDDKHGICEHVIIEADNSDMAWDKLESLEKNVSGLFSSCGCCGARWGYPSKGYDVPTYFGSPIEENEKGAYKHKCFIHFKYGTIKEHLFKEKRK